MEAAEAVMQRCAEALAKIDAALADPVLYTKDPSKARDLSAQREKAHAALHAAEHGWMEAAEAYELALAD
jgi:ATP-binding cassette, subfamily F, member 3